MNKIENGYYYIENGVIKKENGYTGDVDVIGKAIALDDTNADKPYEDGLNDAWEL